MKQHLDKATPVFAIHAINTAWIALLMIGVPSITGIDLGSLRISSNHWLQRLIVAGLGSGLVLNLAMSWRCRPIRQRRSYRGWMLVHAAILTVALLSYSGQIHFDWLRDLLQRVRP